MSSNPFRGIGYVPTYEEILNVAFKRSKSVSPSMPKRLSSLERVKRKDLTMIKEAEKIIISKLSKVVKSFPSIDELDPFYRDLLGVFADPLEVKKTLGSLSGALYVIRRISRSHTKKIKGSEDKREIIRLRRAAFGRFSSVVKKLRNRLIFLRELSKKLKMIPDINTELPSIVVAGAPNVGKSTFVSKVSTAKPEIAPYPFTTKGIIIGHIKRGELRVQVIDTPGLLDRPLSKRNRIELQAITALRHLSKVIIYLFDVSVTRTMDVDGQINLYMEIEEMFPEPKLIPVINKIDAADGNALKEVEDFIKSRYDTESKIFKMSALKGKGVEGVLREALSILSVNYSQLTQGAS
ncbi:MAG: NOG1 family protein [Candidatus Asgardarchaeia archaeon]